MCPNRLLGSMRLGRPKKAHVPTVEGPVILHSAEDFVGMRKAGKLAAKLLNYIQPFVSPGIITEELDRLCHKFILKNGAIPAPLGYKGYPKSVCTSVNQVVCHGIPGSLALKDGDIINIDVTIILNGWHADTSRTFLVGQVNDEARFLVKETEAALSKAIDLVAPGVFLGDIGHLIEKHAGQRGLSVVEDYCGHGIGKSFHTAPSVLHFGQPKTGLRLRPGMFFTIEPMLNIGGHETELLSDGWTVLTKDRSLSAQFEHTVGVTESGVEIFTQL